jgi:CBS domain-containing protein
MLVREIMRKTVSVQVEETLEVAALRLKKENVGALPVVEANRIVGIITDRDILLRGPAGGRSMQHTKAREVMSVGAVGCHDTDDLDHALGLMSLNRIHRLPVWNGNEELVGVLSLNQLTAPSEPAAFEVVFYKRLSDSTGHIHNVELTRVTVARRCSKAEAVQAAIKEFEQERNAVRWDLVADSYDVLERASKPPLVERIRQRAHELWEQEGRPEGHNDDHWARACHEFQMEERDSFVESTGVDQQEKQIPIIPVEKAEDASVPFNEEVKDANEGVEDTTMWQSKDKEPEKQIKTDRPGEKPDPLGRKIASLPLNKMKAGYDYALGKGGKRRS